MSSPSTDNVAGDDPLSVVLGPTDMSDIDSALEDLLNDENADFGIGSTEEEELELDLNTEGDPSLSEKTEEKPSDSKESVDLHTNASSSTPVMSHPLAALPPAPAPAPAPPFATGASVSQPAAAAGAAVSPISSKMKNSSTAVDTIKSFQASVPSMSSVTSSITQLWNQSKPQFGATSSLSSSSGINSNIPTSYNVRNVSNFQQQPLSSSSSSSMDTTSTQPPNLPKTSGGISALLLSHIHSMLKGERIIMLLSHVKRVSQSSFPVASREGKWWCCAMTLYRIILFPYNDVDGTPENSTTAYMGGGDWVLETEREAKGTLIQMPLSTIDRVEKIDEDSDRLTNPLSSGQNFTLVLHGKNNNRYIRFTTSTVADSIRALQTLNTYAFPGRRNLGYLFAFESRRAEVLSATTASAPTKRRFEFAHEFEERLKILPSIHYSKVENSDYGLCGSYPRFVIVPRICGNGSLEGKKMLRKCAAFRSEHRLPALTWARSSNEAGLWRCSQPKVGIQGNRSVDDERYLRMMGDGIDVRRGSGLTWNRRYELTGGEESIEHIENLLVHGGNGLSVKILDMRSKTSAMGNRGTGYGYETASNYPSTNLSFCNITNIHGVRDAYNKLSQLSVSTSVNDSQWGVLVEDTKWLCHVRLILQASWITAFHIHYHNLPVLVHCSHGWDRTSQVAAIAQLFLDPYYRTYDGFATLVEKDFLSFGHPFHTRAGHGEGKGERGGSGSGHGGEGQVSPIFVQFLDCVWQVVQQFPNAFEFNLRYLLVFSEHIYSCRFGTLLCDNEKEREVDASVRQRTYCLFEYLDENKPFLINEFYVPCDNKNEVLLPPLPILLRNVKLWSDRHLKWSPKPSWVGAGKSMEQYLTPENTSQSEETFNSNKKDIMSMRSAMDAALSDLRQERMEKEKWKEIAESLQKELNEMKK